MPKVKFSILKTEESLVKEAAEENAVRFNRINGGQLIQCSLVYEDPFELVNFGERLGKLKYLKSHDPGN